MLLQLNLGFTKCSKEPLCFRVVKSNFVPRSSERIAAFAERQDYSKAKFLHLRIGLLPLDFIAEGRRYQRIEKITLIVGISRAFDEKIDLFGVVRFTDEI